MNSFYDYEPDAEYLLAVVRIPGTDRYGNVVDFSNSHGLSFGVVFPNIRGSSGRRECLQIEWFEPEELEFV